MRAWVGDGLVDAEDARVSVFDRGFRAGEGVFETLRAYGTHPFRLGSHLERAERGARMLGFEPPARDVLAGAIVATADANAGAGDLALRLTLTPGRIDPASPHPGRPEGTPTLVVTAQPVRHEPRLYEHGIAVMSIAARRELPEVKSVSYLAASLARARAQQAGAEEALLTDIDGFVLEGSYSNVFALVHGELVTPPLAAGILAGVTRAAVVELARRLGHRVAERPLALTELLAADEAFVTASTREIVPVVVVDGSAVGAGRPGPVTLALLAAYRDEVRREAAAG